LPADTLDPRGPANADLEEDIQFTAKKYGIPPEEVRRRLEQMRK
jgi:hypothetical protein